MSGLKTFAILGSGEVGTPIINEFLDAELPVTILTRDTSKPALQGFAAKGATLKAVDYSSVDSIASALTGIDALISALGNQHAPELPKDIVTAAKKANVKVVVPSEYGLDYVNPKIAPFPPLIQEKLEVHKYAESIGQPWAAFTNASFGQWLLHPAFGYDIPKRTAVRYLSGDQKISATNTEDIARFVRLTLTSQPVPQPGSGKVYRVEAYVTSPNEILAELEKQVGEKFTVTAGDYEAAKAKQTEASFDGFVAWLQAAQSDGRTKLDSNDNELVGFKPRYTLADDIKSGIQKFGGGQQ
ncbi:hypothetical protein OC846_003737 [Tilletia horrida]|uniref:NmrA-like domain-containing protein n=1 Tax=Tilletia horrida TaxID=155126 RepID=A0AAN6JR24_9BASI|nr:hypothetical protein OC845_003583 [Tilletia horrida]KAK0550257.1 hypothetical protein OC846_003737 [Tilletia horrida]KAK0565403.1 hypothetical protein OC861_003773 [Tilletia horrida]